MTFSFRRHNTLRCVIVGEHQDATKPRVVIARPRIPPHRHGSVQQFAQCFRLKAMPRTSRGMLVECARVCINASSTWVDPWCGGRGVSGSSLTKHFGKVFVACTVFDNCLLLCVRVVNNGFLCLCVYHRSTSPQFRQNSSSASHHGADGT